MTEVENIPLPFDEVSFKPVTSETWEDFQAFFKPRLNYCWCMAWRMTGEEMKDNTAVCRREFIKRRIFSGVPVGILGFIGDQTVAWCSVAPRETYRKLSGEEGLEEVWSIACFYIRKEFRDQGVLSKMIENAKVYARSNGAKYLEAYPVEANSPSYRFMGFTGVFEKAGFKEVKMAGSRRHVMILPL